jgi:hypothetical protein
VQRFEMMQHYDDDCYTEHKVKAEPVWDDPVIITSLESLPPS